VHPVFTTALDRKPRFRCFGLPLLPLTLGHVFLLRELDSPFVTHRESDDLFDDLLLAVFVCAQHHETARCELGKKRRLSLFLAYWGWRCRKIDIVTQAKIFQAYLLHYRTCPNVSGVSEFLPASPQEWRTLAMLTHHFGYSERAAMDCPIAFATAIWAADGDRCGTLTITDTPARLSAFDTAWNHQHRLDLEKLKANADARN
jgi:hypothetical protein